MSRRTEHEETYPAGLPGRINPVCDRFEAELQAGAQPRLEDVLPLVDPADRPVLLRELLALEVEYRRRSGEQPRLEEYQQRIPAQDLAWLAALLAGRPEPPATATASLHESPTAEGRRIRCPHCHNSILLLDDRPDEVLCPGCGGSFRVREAQRTESSSASRPLGKFQLLERVGLGAFGAVWRARDTELDRIVALKIPHTGLLTVAEDLERFHREARAAAQLRHPGIVTVHEVVTLEGLPTIVSDFVSGAPLKDLLEVRQLTFCEAAEVAAQVAEALDYAHTMGLVHRDIKPTNIMVERSVAPATAPKERPALGRPILLDFGLALRNEAEVTLTLDGHIIGTPAYMSPEQAAGKGHKADRRSDVYSLGVVLYELLCGELPFRGTRLMIMQQVLSEEPRAPRRLKDRIPRDLETIALKAMAKEPGRRYQTAGEMAADLRFYLKGEPILARPVGRVEKVWRWCRRYPVVAALSAAVLLSVATAFVLIMLAWNKAQGLADDNAKLAADKARQAEDYRNLAAEYEELARNNKQLAVDAKATGEARLAQQAAQLATQAEAAKGNAVADFLTSMFQASDSLGLGGVPSYVPKYTGEKLTAVDLLQRGQDKVETLAAPPEVKAKIMDAIGSSWRALGQYDKAELILQRAYKLRQDTPLPADHPDMADSLYNLAWVRQDQGNYDEAKSMYRRALEIREKNRDGPNDSRVTAVQFNLAMALGSNWELSEAEPLFQKVIAARIQQQGPGHRDEAIARLGLAGVYLEEKRFPEGLVQTQWAIAIFKKEEGTKSLAIGLEELQEAYTWRSMGFPALAKPLLEDCLLRTRQAFPAQHIYVAFAEFELAHTLDDMHEDAEAEKHYSECVDIVKHTVGFAHPRSMILVVQYGDFLQRKGRTEEANALYDVLLKAQTGRFGQTHPRVGAIMMNWAVLLNRRPPYPPGKEEQDAAALAQMESLVHDAAAIGESCPEPKPPWYKLALFFWGKALLRQGRSKEAVPVLRDDLRRTRAESGEESADVAVTEDLLAQALMAQRQYGDVEEMLLQAESILRKAGAPMQRQLSVALDELGQFYRDQGRLAEAASASRRRLEAWPNDPAQLYAAAAEFASCAALAGQGREEPSAEQTGYEDEALAALSKAAECGFHNAALLDGDPRFGELRRSRKDFRELVRKVKETAGKDNPMQKPPSPP